MNIFGAHCMASNHSEILQVDDDNDSRRHMRKAMNRGLARKVLNVIGWALGLLALFLIAYVALGGDFGKSDDSSDTPSTIGTIAPEPAPAPGIMARVSKPVASKPASAPAPGIVARVSAVSSRLLDVDLTVDTDMYDLSSDGKRIMRACRDNEQCEQVAAATPALSKHYPQNWAVLCPESSSNVMYVAERDGRWIADYTGIAASVTGPRNSTQPVGESPDEVLAIICPAVGPNVLDACEENDRCAAATTGGDPHLVLSPAVQEMWAISCADDDGASNVLYRRKWGDKDVWRFNTGYSGMPSSNYDTAADAVGALCREGQYRQGVRSAWQRSAWRPK